jgi:hypothetical protein
MSYNVKFGFDCMIPWEQTHPGDNAYMCEFCGIYSAGAPRCNKCEEYEEDLTSEKTA